MRLKPFRRDTKENGSSIHGICHSERALCARNLLFSSLRAKKIPAAFGIAAKTDHRSCCVRLKRGSRDERLPERGASGSVQRGPANPARPGREQRYRERLGCRRSPEVPRTSTFKLP